MDLNSETWQTKWARRLALTFLVAVAWASLLGANPVQAQDSSPPSSTQSGDDAKPGFWVQIAQNLFNSRALLDILKQPEFMVLAFVALNVIVFVETGLLIGFFLPGDSLLVTAGVACAFSEWPLWLLLATLCISAIVGDSVGYSIGFKTGPKIFNREKSWLFHKEHLLAAQTFYESHGGKTIILARFMPIIRTFAPVVAGVGKMSYRRFLFFNIFGGVGWVVSMIMIGYYLTSVINPLFMWLLGDENFDVQNHIEKVIIIVVLLSVAPGGVVWLKKKLQSKPAAPTDAAAVPAEPELVARAGK